MIKPVQPLAVLLLLSIVTGCANLPSRDGPPAPVVDAGAAPVPASSRQPGQTPPLPELRPQPPESGPAPLQRTPLPETGSQPELPIDTPAAALLDDVDAAMEAGDLERAAALSERALRIAPREAVLWHRLAEIRYRQQRYDEALGFAQRAESLAGSNARVLRDSQRLQEMSAAAAAR